MAEGGGLLNKEQFSCSICLDLLKDPVTVPCGHSFCMGCIKGCWDQDDHTGVYSCPQCRQTFSPRPVLGKAAILAEVVEKLKTGLQAAPPAHCYAGPGDVGCDICTGRKYKAVKSCLVCLASYCETHLQTHYESPAFKKHKLVKATGNLQEKICSLHDKLLEVYCRADQQCICLLCVMDEHRGHDTVSAAAERIDKQKQLGATQSKFQQRIQEREKDLQDLRQAVPSLKRSAQAAVEDSERIFTELICSIERRCSEVKELIRDQEKAEVSHAEGLLERLEQEITELRRRDAELEQLSHSEDHIHFLQSFESLCAPSEPGDLPSITVSPHDSFEAVRKSVSELQERLEDVFKSELIKVSGKVGEVGVLVQELKTRKDFIQSPVDPPAGERDADCVIVWEKKPTPEEQERAARLQLPPTFFCGVGSDEGEKDKPDDFETELRKAQEDLNEAHDLRHKSSGTTTSPHHRMCDQGNWAEGLQEPFPAAQSFHAAPLTVATTGPSGSVYNPSAAYNSQYPLHTSANATPTKIKNSESLLGLMTSDSPPRNEQAIGQKAATQDQGPVSQTGIFNFGVEKAAGFSIADSAQSQGKTGLFGNTDQPFSFMDVKKPVLGAPSAEEHEKPERCNEAAHVDENEDGPDFEPIVPLSDKMDVKTGEEKELFCNWAKLFRFDSETREWKERGIGSIKILRHKTSGKIRLLMRRDQMLTICANHYITADMVLKPSAGSDKSWVWYAIDYADGMPKPEQLAIRFKTADEAALFKTKFEEAQKVMPKSPQKQEQPVEKEIPPKESSPQTAGKDLDLRALFAKKEGEWDCSVCCLQNSPAAVKCVACQNPNPTAESEADGKAGEEVKDFAATVPSAGAFMFGFGTNASKDSSSASTTQPFGSFSQFTTTIKFGTSDSTSKPIGFGAQFEKKPGQWDCSMCSVRNEASAYQCAVCQSLNPSCKSVFDSPAVSKSSTATFGAGFGSQFLKKEGEWDCSVCCLRNGPTAVKCVACQNPNPTAESEADGKAGEEVKDFAATVPSAGAFMFGFGTNAFKDSSSASTTQPFGSFSQFTTTIKFGTSDSTSKPIGFGAQFEKKPGQWDCSTCSVRNEASAYQCAVCQSLNPSCKSVFDSPAVSKSSTATFGAGFGSQFLKKEGEWDCSVCCLRNGPTAVKCVACQNPNPTAESEAEGKSGKEFKGFAATVPSAGTFAFGFGKDAPKDSSSTASTQPFDSFSQFPTTIKFGTSDSAAKSVDFGAQFEKKPGQWDCSTCSVRNEAPANHCISCQAPNPSSKPVFDSSAASKPPTASSGAGFGCQFTKEEGQWDCDTCLIRNEVSAKKCASCLTPRKIAPNEGLAAMFGKKGGQWDCGTCLVRNAASASACVSCQTLNPNANVVSTSPANALAPPSSAFTFSIGSPKASGAPATTGFKASFNIGTEFKFGQGEDKGSPASFKFELPHSQAESKPSSSKGFSFLMPVTTSPSKFGTKDPVRLAAPAEVSSDAGPASICLKNMAEQHREREEKEVVNAGSSQEGTEQEENLLFSGKQNTFTFADLAKSSQGNFQFVQKDPGFSGFSRAGEQLFASLKPSEKQDSAQDQDEEDMYKTEEQDDIQFDPVVQMPEKVDLVTGEEDEEVLYSHRVKLFWFDADTSQWKERGVGNLKILKNNKNGKLRVVMRREQVFKVCANHLITTTMNLKRVSGSDRAWMWLANDFSEGDANLEQLAAKFKTPEMAEEFKQKFEECQRPLLDIPLQTPHKLVDTGRTAHLIQKAEEMKTGLRNSNHS